MSAGILGSPAADRIGERELYTCGWCGRDFHEDRGQPACRSCPLTRLCGHVRCPHCGWENPVRPGRSRRQAARERGDEPEGARDGLWSALTALFGMGGRG